MVNAPPHTVIETPSFLASAKRLLSDAERAALINSIATNPKQGDLIAGTGGARKMRWARPGEGKSGGYRVVFYYYSEAVPVFLLDIFAKNEQANLSKADRNELASLLADLAKAYLKGAASHDRRR